MRDPGRKALYAFVALAAAAALIRFGADRLERLPEHWSGVVPIVVGFGFGPFALVYLIQALFASRGRARLLAGQGLIARWRVDPAEWERFRAFDSSRGGEGFELVNELGARKPPPWPGVEVIVGEKGVLVDDSYHGLSPRGLPELRDIRWLAGPPRCLEFALLYPRGRHGGTVRTTLRIPVPAGAVGAAQKVHDHFAPRLVRRPGLALRNPRRTYQVCAALLAVTIAAGAAGYAFAGRAGIDPLVPLGMMIGASILAFFLILLVIATLLLDRR